MNEGDKVWLVKYALSRGIEEETVSINAGDFIRVKGRPYGFYKKWRDAHHTKEEAIVAAEGMRKRKIASLKKQVEKLEKLVF